MIVTTDRWARAGPRHSIRLRIMAVRRRAARRRAVSFIQQEAGARTDLRRELMLAVPQRPAQALQHTLAEHRHQVAGLQREAERHGSRPGAMLLRWPSLRSADRA